MDAKKFKQLQEWNELFRNGVITQDEFNKQKAELLKEKPIVLQPTRQEQIIVIFKKAWPHVKDFLYKYRLLSISIVVLTIAFILVYNIFLKPDPENEAKVLAKEYADYQDVLEKDNIASMKTYLNSFNSKHYKTRAEARSELDKILQVNQSKFNVDIQKIDLKYKEQLAEYNVQRGKNAYIFEQTYNSLISSYNANNSNSSIISLQNSIEEKIQSITDPEPDIEKVKTDLVGITILDCTINNLSEIEFFNIINTIRSINRIEYQLFVKVLPGGESNQRECELIAVYEKSETEGDPIWILTDVTFNYIKYFYTVYTDRYIRISIKEGYNWTWNCSNNISWRYQDYFSIYEVQTGPDYNTHTIPTKEYYDVKSLENKDFNISITYRQKE